MPKRTKSYREGLLKSLADVREAAAYLDAALDEDSNDLFLVALRDVAEANQMAKVAKEAGVAREALYRMLRESGNPTLRSLSAILNSLGLRLSIQPFGVATNAGNVTRTVLLNYRDAATPLKAYITNGALGDGISRNAALLPLNAWHRYSKLYTGLISTAAQRGSSVLGGVPIGAGIQSTGIEGSFGTLPGQISQYN